MQRWRKPPILALAYISPARSSKRRMSIIRPSTNSQVCLSGSECFCLALTPAPVAFRVRVASLVATRADCTRWPPSPKTYAAPLPAVAQGRCGVLEPVVATEELVADGNGRHPGDAPLDRLVRRR